MIGGYCISRISERVFILASPRARFYSSKRKSDLLIRGAVQKTSPLLRSTDLSANNSSGSRLFLSTDQFLSTKHSIEYIQSDYRNFNRNCFSTFN